MKNKIAIIGAGVGGLATAARLSFKGHPVEVYEKLTCCGGRANIIEDKGFKFDTGPSFVMMPDFFKEVFDYCQEDIKAYLDLKVLDKNYKIFYPDGDSLTIHKDNQKTEAELERIEPGSSKGYKNFIVETGKIYKAVVPLLYRCFRPQDAFNPAYWKLINKLHLGKSYWQLAKKFFKSDKLCYAFTFEAMFIGVSPFKTPAFYSVIGYTDQVDKIAHPIGGMYQIPKALEKMALKFGTKFNYQREITSLEEIKADKFVINADYSFAQSKLLGKKIPDYDYSCSVLLFYWGMKKKIPNLEHHNLFFAQDLRNNLKNIFQNGIVGDDFSFYIHVPTVTDPSLAPEGKDILYILAPVPNLKTFKGDFKIYEDRIRKKVIAKIESLCGFKIEDSIETEHKFYPEDFIKKYSILYGATFGLAHSLKQSAFFRPPNYTSKQKNIYFVGASTQPGGGLPPVIASSRIVADLITKS
ncbi:MAG: phytoene desaturase [Candidatus Omnitrophica bacterium]|nr:phytoene desaturase [Candidatus Omnitrophota bacterium]